MTPEELSFLRQVWPVDGRTTRAQYAARHGVRRYHDWADTITLPPAFCGLAFSMYAEPADLPPEYLFADCLDHGDARSNLADLETRVGAALGPAAVEDTANCLRRTWRVGVFGVDLHAFPPELQDRRFARNALLARAPELANRATVSLTSAYAWVLPDLSLEGIGGFVSLSAGRPVWSLRHTRRNPPSLHIPGLVAWRDGVRVGISNARDSVVLARAGRLILVRVRAGRGPARCTLDLQGTTVLEGDGEAGLGEVAEHIAGCWGLPLETRREEGDG